MEVSKLTTHTTPSKPKHRNAFVSPRSLDLVAWDPFRRNNIRVISYLVILAIFIYLATVYTFSQSDSQVSTINLMLSNVRVHVGPQPTLDVSLNATVEVKNRAMYSLDYTTLQVEVGYRGKEIGNVTFEDGGQVSVTGSSYVDTMVELYGVDVDLNDLAKGLIEFDVVAHVDGFSSFMQIPLKAKCLCEIDVDIKEQRITRQSCNPTAIEMGFSFTLPIPFVPSAQFLVHIALIF